MKVNPNDYWETPNIELKKAMVNYDILPFLDVCATDRNAKFSNYFTENDDALNQDWNHNFFMNPPYSQIKTWMKKAFDEHKKNNVDGLILTQSKTDTKWWHEFVEGIAEVHFVKGRVKFLLNGIASKNPAPFCSVWIIYRKIK